MDQCSQGMAESMAQCGPTTRSPPLLHRQSIRVGGVWGGASLLHRQSIRVGGVWGGASLLHRQSIRVGGVWGVASLLHCQSIRVGGVWGGASLLHRQSIRMGGVWGGASLLHRQLEWAGFGDYTVVGGVLGGEMGSFFLGIFNLRNPFHPEVSMTVLIGQE